MTVGLSNVLVVTGGTSGIGASLVAEAAARGSFDIYYAGSRAFEAVPENLRSLDATYAQVDVENAEQVRAFRDLVVSKASPEARWLVVASAGISERKDPAKIQRMFGINVGGTQNLLNAFEERLRHDPENLFVGVGSIVAAEGAAVKGDEEYQETKKEVHRISTEIARKRGVNGLTLVPGLIDTPMTRKEIVSPMILLGAVKAAGQDEAHPLRAEILAASGLAAWSSNADVLRAVLGSSLSAIKDAAKVED